MNTKIFKDLIYNSAGAAKYLSSLLCDGRNYVSLLEDQRRGRRTYSIPCERRLFTNEVIYRKSDLLDFVAAEVARGVKARRVRFAVERTALRLGTLLPGCNERAEATLCRRVNDLESLLGRLG